MHSRYAADTGRLNRFSGTELWSNHGAPTRCTRSLSFCASRVGARPSRLVPLVNGMISLPHHSNSVSIYRKFYAAGLIHKKTITPGWTNALGNPSPPPALAKACQSIIKAQESFHSRSRQASPVRISVQYLYHSTGVQHY